MARIILVALFVLAVSAQRAPLHSCTPHNPFLKFMSRHGMPVYPKPKLGVPMCGSEFALHGTCCNERKIKAYVEKDKTVIQEATQKIIFEFNMFMDNSPRLLDLAKSLVDVRNKVQLKFVRQQNTNVGRKLQRARRAGPSPASRPAAPKPPARRPQRAHSSVTSPQVARPAPRPQTRLPNRSRSRANLAHLRQTQINRNPKRRVKVTSVLQRRFRVFSSSKPRPTSKAKQSHTRARIEVVSRKGKHAKHGRKERKNCKNGKKSCDRSSEAFFAELQDPMTVVRQLRELVAKLKRIHDDNQFTIETKACWDHIANIRASSVCSTCSGRSHEFFIGGKALMSQEVCVGVLDKCYKPLRQLTFFVKVLNLIPAVIGFNSKISQLKENAKANKDTIAPDLSTNMNTNELGTLAALFHKAQFIPLIKAYTAQNDLRGTELYDARLMFKAQRNLCSRFMVLNRAPIIVQVARLFAKTTDEKTHTKSLIDKIHSSIHKAQNILDRDGHMNPNWRVLQVQTANAGKSLGADVAIVSPDNHSAYSGIGVSGHHAMDFSNQP